MTGARLAVVLATAAVLSAPQMGACAADADGVAKKAETCVACHGPDGNSRMGDTPSWPDSPNSSSRPNW